MVDEKIGSSSLVIYKSVSLVSFPLLRSGKKVLPLALSLHDRAHTSPHIHTQPLNLHVSRRKLSICKLIFRKIKELEKEIAAIEIFFVEIKKTCHYDTNVVASYNSA